jgi:hypothetical protein
MEAIDNIKSIVLKHVVYLQNRELIDAFLNQMNTTKNIDYQNEKGDTLISIYCSLLSRKKEDKYIYEKNESDKIMLELLDFPFDMNIPNRIGVTPFADLCFHKFYKSAMFCITHDDRLRTITTFSIPNRKTPIFYCCMTDDHLYDEIYNKTQGTNDIKSTVANDALIESMSNWMYIVNELCKIGLKIDGDNFINCLITPTVDYNATPMFLISKILYDLNGLDNSHFIEAMYNVLNHMLRITGPRINISLKTREEHNLSTLDYILMLEHDQNNDFIDSLINIYGPQYIAEGVNYPSSLSKIVHWCISKILKMKRGTEDTYRIYIELLMSLRGRFGEIDINNLIEMLTLFSDAPNGESYVGKSVLAGIFTLLNEIYDKYQKDMEEKKAQAAINRLATPMYDANSNARRSGGASKKTIRSKKSKKPTRNKKSKRSKKKNI